MIMYSATTRGFYNSDHHQEHPADAQVVSEARYKELFAGQAKGQEIYPDENGVPQLRTIPVPTPEQHMVNLRARRDRLLAATDWTQAVDVPKDTAKTYQAYRKALRDLPGATKDPANPVWPTPPK